MSRNDVLVDADWVQAHLDDPYNLAPRIGATWSPFKSGATTFRAGFGIDF